MLATAPNRVENEEDIEIEGSWLVRTGDALFELSKFQDAKKYYKEGLNTGAYDKDDKNDERRRIEISIVDCEQRGRK